MILLLGASGYFGKTFANELRRRGRSFIPLTREAFDYTRFDFLFDYLRTMRPAFVINAASYCTDPSEGPEDLDREKAMSVNALLPQMISRVCLMTKTPWGHVSSGSIYSGLKVLEHGRWRQEKDSTKPGLADLPAASIAGFNETDEPNFSFRFPPCDFYSGTKALAEEAIREIGECYIWRLREPFNERDEACNFLARLKSSGVRGLNSFSHLEDSVRACVDLWEYHAPFGIYNVVNPGPLHVDAIAQRLHGIVQSNRFAWIGRDQAARPALRGLRSNCVLDASKLLKAGIRMRPATEALDDALDRLETTHCGVRATEAVHHASA
ncbi:MAG TPA: sugar nucleotide-binding protein [Verrucomicrobiae bacterium]|nr:sugar nucleotide-binding protein [Verrucomicrobiae bacterium]